MNKLSNVSVFGWLDGVPIWRDLPYPIKGGILRALKAALAGIIGLLLSAATAGTLFPVTASPYIVIMTTLVLQGLDKWIREQKIANDTGTEDVTDVPVADTDVTNVDK